MYKKKLLEFGYQHFGDPVTSAEKRLEEFEVLIEHRLPEDYRLFLLETRGPIDFNKHITYRPIEDSPCYSKGALYGFDVFYGFGEDVSSNKYQIYTLLWNYRIYNRRMPLEVFPIGSLPFGDQMCLCYQGKCVGKIYYWNHDDEQEISGNIENDYRNMFLIANSFAELFNKMKVTDYD
jgi:hypothetical protein